MKGLIYVAEILLAELIFLYPVERKPCFPARYAAAWLASMAFVALTPTRWLIKAAPAMAQPIEFVQFILQIAVTVAAMGCCFKLSWTALTACCAAGVAVQHIAFHVDRLLRLTGFTGRLTAAMALRQELVEFCVFLPVYVLFFLTLGRSAEKKGYCKHADRRFGLISVAIILICIGLTRVSNSFGDSDSITVSLYAITACFMALMVQLVLNSAVNLEHERELESLLLQEEHKQYELSKKTVDAINIKYHDLKYKLRDLAGRLPEEELESIQSAVDVYGRQVKTGSETLDVLLTTYSLQCGEEGITLTYTGQGGDLSFMSIMDVYSLFGNAISNAVEAVRQLDDPEKRVVDIHSERMGDMVGVSISNFFSGECRMEDGLPVTTKREEEGFHGYGMRSMRLVAEKYGGSLSVTADGQLFNLNIYLMQR